MDEKVNEKLERLQQIIKQYAKVAVGFSAGTDSTFLLKVCRDILMTDEESAEGKRAQTVFPVTAESAMFSDEEKADAAALCRAFGLRQQVVTLTWDDMSAFVHNPPERCYLCKKTIFAKIIKEAEQAGADVIFDGTNADDMQDYRPGHRALKELDVVSPLRDAGLTKSEIRELSKAMGLPTWDRPAFACLASRIPYDEVITQEKLASIAAAEKGLRMLGFAQVRVRHHGSVARIEILPEDMRRFWEDGITKQADHIVKSAGFRFAALDLGGYKMGGFNPAGQ